MNTRRILSRRGAASLLILTLSAIGIALVPTPAPDPPGWVPGEALVEALVVHGPYQGSLSETIPPPEPVTEGLTPENLLVDDVCASDCSAGVSPVGARPRVDDAAVESADPSNANLYNPVHKFLVTPSLKQGDPQMAASAGYFVISGLNQLYFYGKDGNPLAAKSPLKPLDNPLMLSTLFGDIEGDVNATANLPRDLSTVPCAGMSPTEVAGLGGLDESCGYFLKWYYDARVIFDPYRKRFLVGALLKNAKGDKGTYCGQVNQDCIDQHDAFPAYARRDRVVLAVSKTQDPRDGFWVYWWNSVVHQGACTGTPADDPPVDLCPGTVYEPGRGTDYDVIGISSTYYLEYNGTNRFGDSRALLNVVRADELAQGLPTSGWHIYNIKESEGNDIAEGSLSPAVHHGDSAGLSYFVRLRGADVLNVWSLDASFPPTLLRREIPVNRFAGQLDAPQMAIDGTVSPGLVHYSTIQSASYRNGRLHVTFGTKRVSNAGECTWKDPSDPNQGCLAAIRLFRVDPVSGTTSIDRTFGRRHMFDPPGVYGYYGWPSVEVNKDGDIAVVYMRSGRQLFPEARYSVWPAYASDIGPSTLLQPGEAPVGAADPDTPSGISVDPFDDTTVWVSQFYGYRSNPISTTGKFRMVVGKVFGLLYSDVFVRSFGLETDTLQIGGTTSASLTVGNQGDGSADGIEARIVLSPDPRISMDDLGLGTLKLPSIASGGQATAETEITLPQELVEGRFYVGVILDPGGLLREYVEDNNTPEVPCRLWWREVGSSRK